MIANQSSRGLSVQRAARWVGLLGSCIALLAACGGTIEETEVDQQHLENGNTGTKQTAAPQANSSSASTPRPSSSNATASANNTASTPPASSTPAASTTPPASTPPDTSGDEEDDPPPASGGGGDLSFAADVWPIFNTSCGPCHTAGSSGGQAVGGADKTAALADAKRIEAKILSDLETGRMPLGCSKPPGGGGTCVTQEQFDTIQDWYDSGAAP